MKLIDTHVHAFPDFLAEKAIRKLSIACSTVSHQADPMTNGTFADTLAKQKEWGTDYFVLLNIATTPESVPKVNDFLLEHNEAPAIPFGSIHPQYTNFKEEIRRLADAGVKGVKFHPEYQEFDMDDPAVYPIYEELGKNGMIMLFHAGYDPAYESSYRSYPKKAAKVVEDFQGIKIILAHMGNLTDSAEAMEYLVGKDVFFDISMAHTGMGKKQMESMIKAHGVDRFLYATDCPWSNGLEVQELVRSFDLTQEEKEKIFYKNAAKLLNLTL